MSERAPLLCVRGLSRSYDGGAVQALRNVGFTATAGEVLALTGPSGCGKSSLLSLIGMLDRPTAGSILIAGQDTAQVTRPSLFRARNIGFVFQFHHLVPTMTLQENVEAPMLALGVPWRDRRAQASEMLRQMDLTDRASFLPGKVSGGERQRAAVARALINRPAVLLADEPTGNLDTKNGQTVVDLLVRHARAQGALVLMATHNPEIAAAMDRTIALLDGVQVSAGRTRRHDLSETVARAA